MGFSVSVTVVYYISTKTDAPVSDIIEKIVKEVDPIPPFYKLNVSTNVNELLHEVCDEEEDEYSKSESEGEGKRKRDDGDSEEESKKPKIQEREVFIGLWTYHSDYKCSEGPNTKPFPLEILNQLQKMYSTSGFKCMTELSMSG